MKIPPLIRAPHFSRAIAFCIGANFPSLIRIWWKHHHPVREPYFEIGKSWEALLLDRVLWLGFDFMIHDSIFLVGGRTNPIWKICASLKLDHFPQNRCENEKNATPPSFPYVVNHTHPQASVSIFWGDWYYFNPPIKDLPARDRRYEKAGSSTWSDP